MPNITTNHAITYTNTRELYNITYIRPLFFEATRFCDFCFFLFSESQNFGGREFLFCFSAKLLQNHKIKVFAKYADVQTDATCNILIQQCCVRLHGA